MKNAMNRVIHSKNCKREELPSLDSLILLKTVKPLKSIVFYKLEKYGIYYSYFMSNKKYYIWLYSNTVKNMEKIIRNSYGFGTFSKITRTIHNRPFTSLTGHFKYIIALRLDDSFKEYQANLNTQFWKDANTIINKKQKSNILSDFLLQESIRKYTKVKNENDIALYDYDHKVQYRFSRPTIKSLINVKNHLISIIHESDSFKNSIKLRIKRQKKPISISVLLKKGTRLIRQFTLCVLIHNRELKYLKFRINLLENNIIEQKRDILLLQSLIITKH